MVKSAYNKRFITLFFCVTSCIGTILWAQEEEEQEWHWRANSSDSGYKVGIALNFDEAKAAMHGACASCSKLSRDSYSDPFTLVYSVEPEEIPANTTGWSETLQETLASIEASMPSACRPTRAYTVGGWYIPTDGPFTPHSLETIDIDVAYYRNTGSDGACNETVISDLYKGERRRDYFCPEDYRVLYKGIESTVVCSNLAWGRIYAPSNACDCAEDFIDGNCVSREMEWVSAQKSARHGNYMQISDLNNAGRRCARIVPSNSCPAEAPLESAGLVGNPIHCADGQKVQVETDYKAPVGNLEISRIYTNEPQAELEEFYKRSFSSIPANVRLLPYYRIEDPSWLLNIPRLLYFGGDLKAVQPGNGARYLFNNGVAALSHFGTLEENDDGDIYTGLNGTEYLKVKLFVSSIVMASTWTTTLFQKRRPLLLITLVVASLSITKSLD